MGQPLLPMSVRAPGMLTPDTVVPLCVRSRRSSLELSDRIRLQGEDHANHKSWDKNPLFSQGGQRFSNLMVVVSSDAEEVVSALFRTASAEIRTSLISFCIEQCCIVRLRSRLHFDGLREFIRMALDRS